MTEVNYGISILSDQGELLHDENGLALFETMSGIKSVIGTLAIEKALQADIDFSVYTLSATVAHATNGVSGLQKLLTSHRSSIPLTLKETLGRNIANSDGVATNLLIDYLDGADHINEAILRQFGVHGLELVTDRIWFHRIDHRQQPFQLGKGTMRDFSSYYRQLWTPDSTFNAPEHKWHRAGHALPSRARLFGIFQSDLPDDTQWLHKTGSSEDELPNNLYKTMMDAGELTRYGRTLYVAAAYTVNHLGPDMPARDVVESDFAERNEKALADA